MVTNMAKILGKNGGARPGAGRPKGAISKRTEETLDRAKEGGILPMDVLLEDMRLFHKLGIENFVLATTMAELEQDERTKLAKEALMFKGLARECAVAVSPYIHPKLSSIDANVSMNVHETALAELD